MFRGFIISYVKHFLVSNYNTDLFCEKPNFPVDCDEHP